MLNKCLVFSVVALKIMAVASHEGTGPDLDRKLPPLGGSKMGIADFGKLTWIRITIVYLPTVT